MCQLLTPQLTNEQTISRGAFEAWQRPLADTRELLKMRLPEDPTPYIDKYFLRTHEILKADGLNPFVRAQVFFRADGLSLFGVEEGIAMIEKYSDLIKNGGRVYALKEGAEFKSGESVLVIEGRIQDIVKIETLYLGALARETTAAATGTQTVDLQQVEKNARAIKNMIGDRNLIYMGARHWHWSEDAEIAAAAFRGGADACSTDIGGKFVEQPGVGTIPHALEVIYAYYYGRDNAVKESTIAFDRYIDPNVQRIALNDFNNKEIDDSIETARALDGRLGAVRIDTPGENFAQGGVASPDLPEAKPFLDLGIPKEDLKYWFGRGVSVTAVYALRQALDQAGFPEVEIVLSSGFAKPEKVAAFVRAEELLNMKLFDTIGAGGLYSPCVHATMDIVAVADTLHELDQNLLAKSGRGYKPNPRLELVLGGEK